MFIDISGDYVWSEKGTPFLVITSLICSDIEPLNSEVYKLRHTLIGKGYDIERFHACDDCFDIKSQMYDLISDFSELRIDSVIVDKRKVAVSLRPLSRLYPELITQLLKNTLHPDGIYINDYDRVIVITDRESCSKKEKGAIRKAVSQNISRHMSGIPYQLFMHNSFSHTHLQVVDYFSWAIYRKWTIKDTQYYDKIKKVIKSEVPILQEENEIFYGKNDPPS
ncbi:MAG: DUF3800 domain-containing protein [Dehalococcoidales bacterium]|nr:DUF3800 domain-containing protein [Dehalococcoidales bacterium]